MQVSSPQSAQSTPTAPELKAALDRAVDFFLNAQMDNGEFRVYGLWKHKAAHEVDFDSSVFATPFVLQALTTWEHPAIPGIRAKGIAFLQDEMQGNGLWRYWTRKNIQYRFIPDDMDDTCCISHYLKQWQKAPQNTSLILANRNRQGLFYTWFLPRWRHLLHSPRFWFKALIRLPLHWPIWWKTEAKPGDVDYGVNVNALLYLGERLETQAAIQYIIEKYQQRESTKIDNWYMDLPSHQYFLSQAYRQGVQSLGVLKEQILSEIAQRRGKDPVNPLEAGLTLCTLMNLEAWNADWDKWVDYLLRTQEENGQWPRSSFYYAGPKQIYNFGSAEFTTAFCLEALARYYHRKGASEEPIATNDHQN